MMPLHALEAIAFPPNPPPQLPIAVEAITLLPNLLPQFLIAVEAIALFPPASLGGSLDLLYHRLSD